MFTAAKGFAAVLCGVLLFMGGSVFVFGAGTPPRMVNLPAAAINNAARDDDVPEVTARVARISFIRGEARVRRSGGAEWEKAALNLPIVEGDEIATDGDARVEIQFGKDQHLRLAENSYLKIVNLKDAGIAVSLSLGTLNLRVTAFDKDKSFFEIDAPKTTMAVQRSGAYRVDAGKEGSAEVRVSAGSGGEARVYSDNAGFTLKNGRSTRIFIDGANAGEWETADASRFGDDFDTWSADRDSAIAKRLKDAYYDKYYDNDIYGADDLSDNGQWVYTKNYGYVWRPFPASIGRYADWSPYRYGHWRWIPPFGWTWVNDEPWGWATYHHGRWFYDDGYWNWSPYGYYRQTRSWWSPALVVINIVNNNVCWYPIGYHHRNRYRGWDRPRDPVIDGRETVGILGRVKTPIRNPRTDPSDLSKRTPVDLEELPADRIPPGGVVTTDKKDFGTTTKGIRRAPMDIARSVLAKKTDDPNGPDLPIYADVSRRIGRDISTERPDVDGSVFKGRLGAEQRKSEKPMDNELRTTRIFGGRQPKDESVNPGDMTPVRESRKTGAVERPTVKDSPRFEPPIERETPRNISPGLKDSPRFEPPVENENPRYRPPTPKDSPRYEPPVEREKPRYTPPAPKESPRFEQPPVRERPRDNQPPIKDSPPLRNEPKPEPRPAKPPEREYKKSPNDTIDQKSEKPRR